MPSVVALLSLGIVRQERMMAFMQDLDNPWRVSALTLLLTAGHFPLAVMLKWNTEHERSEHPLSRDRPCALLDLMNARFSPVTVAEQFLRLC